MSQRTTGTQDAPSDGSRSTPSVPRRALEWLANRHAFVLMGVLFVLGFTAERLPVPDWIPILLFLAGGVLPLVLATVSTEEDGYDHDMSARMRAKLLTSQLAWAITPWGLFTQVLQLGGTALAYLRHLGRPPGRNKPPETVLIAPFDGEWTAVNGGVTQAASHSWGIVSQRYAYDFVVADEDGNTHADDGDELADYYAFGEPIQAPADGIVVKTKDGLRDYPRPGSGWLEWRTWEIAGNHVVIKHADGEYTTLAHLKQGSVRVAPRDEIGRGDVVGKCGNSGLSSEPHLHIQLQDRASFWLAAGLVPRFKNVTITRLDNRRTEHEVYDATEGSTEGLYLWAGDRVRPVATPNGGSGNKSSETTRGEPT